MSKPKHYAVTKNGTLWAVLHEYPTSYHVTQVRRDENMVRRFISKDIVAYTVSEKPFDPVENIRNLIKGYTH